MALTMLTSVILGYYTCRSLRKWNDNPAQCLFILFLPIVGMFLFNYKLTGKHVYWPLNKRKKIPDFSDFFLLKCVNTDWVDMENQLINTLKKLKSLIINSN